MNSLYLDKRNFFNCKLDIMSSHNKELRQQRIREMELAAPKIKFEYQEIVENHARDMEIERFAATFLRKKNKKDNKRKKSTVWENRYHLRIAYQHIQDWKTHYFALESDLPLWERKRKITFSL